MIGFINSVSLPRLLSATAVFMKYKDTSVFDIDETIVTDILSAVGVNPEPETVALLMTSAKSEDPGTTLMAWGRKKLEDGTLQKIIRPTAQRLVRCPHCKQPHYVDLD